MQKQIRKLNQVPTPENRSSRYFCSLVKYPLMVATIIFCTQFGAHAETTAYNQMAWQTSEQIREASAEERREDRRNDGNESRSERRDRETRREGNGGEINREGN